MRKKKKILKKDFLKLKEKFYKIIVRLTMLYGSECWAIKKIYIQKVCVAKMRMLRWMCGEYFYS